LSLRGTGTPLIIGDDGVLVGTASGKLLALGLQDGKPVWEAVIATPRGRTELERIADVDADLALVGAVVYASSYQGVLSAISLGGGQILWNRDIASSTGIVADREQIYVSASDGTVWALSRSNGATMWRQPALQYRRLSAPVQQGNYLIVGDYEGYLHWLHKEDGRLVARTQVRDWREHWPLPDEYTEAVVVPVDRAVLMAPAVSGSWVYALDKRGVLDVYEVIPVESRR
jgi:outer membrane protein assembly factor BamB